MLPKLTRYEIKDICTNEDFTMKELANIYGLTYNQVNGIRRRFGGHHKFYTKEEKKYIKKAYLEGVSILKIALKLERDVQVLRSNMTKWRKLGEFPTARRRTEYTEEELNYIKTNYPIKSGSEIAKKLNRSPKSIYSLAHRLGLRKAENYEKPINREWIDKMYTKEPKLNSVSL